MNQALKKILLKPQDLKNAKKIEESFGIQPIAARILSARGFKIGSELQTYLNPTLKEGLPNPESLKGLSEACSLISSTIKNKQKIAIACDFDVDGLTGGSQVFDFLKRLNVDVAVYVPNRFTEGYGLNAEMIKKIKEEGASLLICIDFGTTNQKELDIAKSLGLKTIVIDHHHVGELKSTADVFINPQQKGCGFADKILSASGLAWFLLIGLRQHIDEARKIDVREFLDLASLGTICDMVPLIGVNRIIAKRGLETLSTTQRPGIKSLKFLAGIKNPVSCYDVGFGIGPRINAAGRIVHGEVVIELLTTQDKSKAESLAQTLHKLNAERQEIEAQMKEIAVADVSSKKVLPYGISVARQDFHTGVIGIVAQRMVEAFYRPAAILGEDNDGIFKGSVRGIKGFSVVKALENVSDHLIKYGGHEGAGGFSIEAQKYPHFSKAWDAECKRQLEQLDIIPSVEADTEATLSDIQVSLIDEIEKFAPFGLGNPSPQLYFEKMRVIDVKTLKSAHTKAILTDGKKTISGLLWKTVDHPHLHTGALINLVARPDTSSYNGITELQLTLTAIEKA